MKFSYKFILSLFFIAYLFPILLIGFLVQSRIETRQLTLQRFLQDQIEVDRKLADQRTTLRNLQPQIRNYLLGGNLSIGHGAILEEISKTEERLEAFFKKYENSYAGNHRLFLIDILAKTRETDLVREESELLLNIDRSIAKYLSEMKNYLSELQRDNKSLDEHTQFLVNLDEGRAEIFQNLDSLAEVRYIFAQRVVSFISGENSQQRNFFLIAFIILFATIFIVSMLEYFYIHKPFSDIIIFLQSLHGGKSHRHLYFSSPIKEINESEAIINEIIDKAEDKKKEEKKEAP